MATLNERSLQGRFSTLEKNWDKLTPHEKMDKLDVFYSNNSLYDDLATYARDNDLWLEAIKPLRNPTHRSVEFFATKLCLGNPKILVASKSNTVLTAIQQVQKWSGFATNKRPMLRKNTLYGNLFVKVMFDGKKMVEIALDTKNVTDFEEDERGFLTSIRIDVTIENHRTYTEYWTKNDGFNGYVATWEHVGGREMKLENLGDAQTFNFLTDFGIDFIPIVHSKFTDVGEKWGRSAVDHAIEKIEEWDRKATVLSEMMFQSDMFLILRNGIQESGMKKPAGLITKPTDDDTMKWSRFKILKANGWDEVKTSALDFAWSEFKAILDGDGEEIKQDLPELKYYDIKENELSGIAMRTLLAGALDRANEAQEAFVTGQVRANEMALTMGKFYGLFPSTIGDYANGDFNHDMQFEEVIPINSQSEKITNLASMANIEMPIQMKMQICGFSPEEIALMPVNTVSTPTQE